MALGTLLRLPFLTAVLGGVANRRSVAPCQVAALSQPYLPVPWLTSPSFFLPLSQSFPFSSFPFYPFPLPLSFVPFLASIYCHILDGQILPKYSETPWKELSHKSIRETQRWKSLHSEYSLSSFFLTCGLRVNSILGDVRKQQVGVFKKF